MRPKSLKGINTMTGEMSLVKKYVLYLNERFPIPGVVMYAGSLYWMAYAFGGLIFRRDGMIYSDFIPGFVLFFLVFLHLRLFDEHKDFEKDVKAYPQRMLSRGIITLKELRFLIYPAIALEAVISIYLGLEQLIVWLLVLLWTVLMLMEFFIPEYLNKRIGLYLLSHQLLVPIMMAFPLSQRMENFVLSERETIALLMLFAGTMCLTVTYEMARKTWPAERENEFADSYSKAWGIGSSVVVTSVVALAGTMLLCALMIVMDRKTVYIVVNIVMIMILLAMELVFYKQQTVAASKKLEIAGALYMLVTFINSAISFMQQW